MGLDITVDDRPAATVVAISGELDLNTAPELLQTLTRAIDDGRRHLIVDLSRLTFCDSSGLSVLVRVKNRLDEVAGDMRLASPLPIVSRVLDVSGLAEVFGTYPSVTDAYAAVLRGAPSVVETVMDDC